MGKLGKWSTWEVVVVNYRVLVVQSTNLMYEPNKENEVLSNLKYSKWYIRNYWQEPLISHIHISMYDCSQSA